MIVRNRRQSLHLLKTFREKCSVSGIVSKLLGGLGMEFLELLGYSYNGDRGCRLLGD